MTDRQPAPRDDAPAPDDLDDELTVEGDDEVLAEIRAQLAERNATADAGSADAVRAAPHGTDPGSGVADDLDDDMTIADPGVLDAIRRQVSPGPDDPPTEAPADDSVDPLAEAPADDSVDPLAAAPVDDHDDHDDATISAPDGHPARASHPTLGDLHSSRVPPDAPPPGPAADQEPIPAPPPPSQAPPAPPAPPAADPALPDPGPPPNPTSSATGRSADTQSSGGWAPPPRTPREPAATTRPSAPTGTGSNDRSIPVWVLPTVAAVVLAALLLWILL